MATPFSSAGRSSNVNSNLKINYKVVGNTAQPKADLSSGQDSVKTIHGFSKDLNLPIWKIDMGREAHFTVSIDGISLPNMQHKNYHSFLPLKSFSYTPVSVDHLTLNAGLFTDLPIPNRRKVGRIELEVLDTVNHYYENSFFSWYANTVPDYNGYVGYLSDSVRKLTYREYNNEGKNIVTYYFEVIPDGDVKVSRQYDNDGLKSVSITLVIVGIISTTSSLYKQVVNTQDSKQNANTSAINNPTPPFTPVVTPDQEATMSIGQTYIRDTGYSLEVVKPNKPK